MNAYLSSCQLGITLASLGLGWIGEPAVAQMLEPALAVAGVVSKAMVEGIAFAVAFTVISFLHIVLREFAPKSLALRKPEAVFLATARQLSLPNARLGHLFNGCWLPEHLATDRNHDFPRG